MLAFAASLAEWAAAQLPEGRALDRRLRQQPLEHRLACCCLPLFPGACLSAIRHPASFWGLRRKAALMVHGPPVVALHGRDYREAGRGSHRSCGRSRRPWRNFLRGGRVTLKIWHQAASAGSDVDPACSAALRRAPPPAPGMFCAGIHLGQRRPGRAGAGIALEQGCRLAVPLVVQTARASPNRPRRPRVAPGRAAGSSLA